jgi:hypothetical protein
MSHQAPAVTQSLSGKLRILDHKYLRTVEPWLPIAVWGLTLEGTLTATLLARQVERRGKRCDLVPIRQETQLSVLGTLKTTIYTSTEQTR